MTAKRAKAGEAPAAAEQGAMEAAAQAVLQTVAERAAASVLPEPPQGGELVVDPRKGDGEVFRVMDAYDEAQILDELEGRPSDKMVYSFSSGGKLQTGLSYVGVAECVRTLNTRGLTQIRAAAEPVPTFREFQEEDEDGTVVTYVECLVYATDERNGGGQWGVARQPKFMAYNQEKSPGRKPTLDKFATAKALSKAQRNAELPLIPVAFREVLIALALNQPGRVQTLRAGVPNTKQDTLGPVLADPRSEELRGEIRAAYAGVRALPGGTRQMPPGRFNAKLRRAETIDHAAMEEFRDELLSLRDHLAAPAEGAST